MFSRTTRRALVAVSAVAATSLALAGCASSDATPSDDTASVEPTPITYQMGWLPTVEWASSWIAIDEGLYEDAGVAFEYLPGGPNVSDDTVVASGQADVGSASVDSVAAAVEAGADFKIIAAAFKKSPFSIVSLAETPIETPEDMIGKKIGVAAANQSQFDLFLEINEIDPADVEVVPVQFDPSPVANGEVDGQVVYSVNEPGQLNVQGIDTYTMLFADFGFEVLTDVYYVTPDTIAEKGEALAAFLSATSDGWDALFADPQLGVDLTLETYGADLDLNGDQQLLQVAAMQELMGSEPYLIMTDDEMQASVDTVNLMGYDFTVEDLFDTSIQELMG
ncbi:ABC transporter substrate-binding protein [Microbacter sp. GSS18]|nr:ABC transporter substrate-binding protein [Microbacter sp. GSS18]